VIDYIKGTVPGVRKSKRGGAVYDALATGSVQLRTLQQEMRRMLLIGVVGILTLFINLILLYTARSRTTTLKTRLNNGDKQSVQNFSIKFYSVSAQDPQIQVVKAANKTMTAIPGTNLPLCPRQPSGLVGRFAVNVNRLVNVDDVVKENPQLKPGGFFSPSDCQPRDKVAIVIPFRDREAHLSIFLHYMVPVLRRQLLQFKIYVIEQAGNCSINIAVLRNIGAVEATKDSDWQCFCFHDVDMILENDHNLYACPASPTHLSVATDKWNYK
jgi:hypothetical protein